MARLFISYARPSLEEVEALAQDLRDLEHTVWFDQHLVGGTPWWSRILEAIRESDAFVYAVSPAAAQSLACRRELQYAEDLGLRIVPVQVQAAALSEHPPAIQRLQVIDYVSPGRAHAVGLARAVASIAPRGSLPDPLPEPPPPPMLPLAELRELATQEAPMSFEAQSAWVMRARAELKSPAGKAEVLALAGLFRKRKDLYAVVAEDLAAMGTPEPAPMHAPQPPAAPEQGPAGGADRMTAPAQEAPVQRRKRAARPPAAAQASAPASAGAAAAPPPASPHPRAFQATPRIDRSDELGKFLLVGTLPGIALGLVAWMVGLDALPFWIPEGFPLWLHGLGRAGLVVFLAIGAGLIVFLTWAFVAEEIMLIDAGESFFAALKGGAATAVVAYSVAGGARLGLDLPLGLLSGFALHLATVWICIYRYTPGRHR